MTRTLTIDGCTIHDASTAYVIAEIGHNHQGDLDQAMKMIATAKRAGASAVKLQKRANRSLYTQAFYNRPYTSAHSFGPTYGAHREALELGESAYRELQAYCRALDITLFATVFDFPSADFLAALDMPAYKIASGDLRNTPLLRYVARLGKPVILSTGAATLDDVRRAVGTVCAHNPQVAVLQCTAAYPAQFAELDLRVIGTYRHEFPQAVVGYSGHERGASMALAAYVQGARIIEKHFTLSRSLKGTDHAFSLEPRALRRMVRRLRQVQAALGSAEKQIHLSEHPALEKMGKTLVAARDLPAGAVVGPQDVAIKSPGGGLPPYQLPRLVGVRLQRSLQQEQPFADQDLQPTRLVSEEART